MPPSTSPSTRAAHGWLAVPRSLSTLLSTLPQPITTPPIPMTSLSLPSNPLINHITTHARTHLSRQTFAHSMRVYYFSKSILTQHFTDWKVSDETLLLTCLLHDIATTEESMASTWMSFEFAGGITALELLKEAGSPQIQRESVAETIIRHQDLGDTGNISQLTAIIHFATVLDNAGLNSELVHRETIESIVNAWPREGWTGCFAGVVRKEMEYKPWSNTTRIEGFAEMVEGNKLMQEWD